MALWQGETPMLPCLSVFFGVGRRSTAALEHREERKRAERRQQQQQEEPRQDASRVQEPPSWTKTYNVSARLLR